jgi:membrane peptidoglycan carboxypeptidase
MAAIGLLLVVGVPLGVWEARTSNLQSRFFSARGAELDWVVRPGASARIRFPAGGPWDARLGYSAIEGLEQRARGAGFEVVQQAVLTEAFQQRVDAGWYPVYPEKSQGGLTIRDRGGRVLHRSPMPARVYADFDSIPELIWRSLVYIENRAFLDEDSPRRNPAVDWPRLTRAVGELGLQTLGSDRNVPGGSTLATQLEKFRHSPEGRTGSAMEKLRQMEAAAMRAYIDGPETLRDRRRTVRDYLNSVPLAAQRGHGEVIGASDGLWAWYGTDFADATMALRANPVDDSTAARRAEVYRQAVSLLVAHRRPSFYLVQPEGREELDRLTDVYLRLMARDSVIPQELAREALATTVEVLPRAPERPPPAFVERKAANTVRTGLLSLLGLPGLYDLDRLDLTARTTIDMGWQEGVSAVFDGLHDPAFVRSGPFAEARLLGTGDPTAVLYTFTLLERTPLGNVVRVQTDNFDGPLSLTSAGRLELGSTAKLRTLVTYLEIVAEVHDRLSEVGRDSLARIGVPAQDRLTGWVIDRLRAEPSISKAALLEEALHRTYSANPRERFATGGGIQTFSNFTAADNGRVVTVLEAFEQSINLPFVRIMRDVVHYYMFLGSGSTASALTDADDPLRQAYLERFADREGRGYTRQFFRRYETAPPDSLLSRLVEDRALSPTRTAWAFRAVRPEADLTAFDAFLRSHTPLAGLTPGVVEDLYRQTDPNPWDLNDLGYLARIHPLELWVVQRLVEAPDVALGTLLEEGAAVRQEVYGWLFRTSRRNAQDQRIRSMLELEAFELLLADWRRLGYPFGNLVPSLGTSIGSSGDRPMALAELLGIVVNDGVRLPVLRVDELHLAEGTPFETRLGRRAARGVPVLDPLVAAATRRAMIGVAENGTARRAAGSVRRPDGEPMVMGAKTGTGDNRYRVYSTGGGLLESRAVNRTATLVFFLDDRYFGVVTAYVPGPAADNYRFTSALPSEIFKNIASVLNSRPESIPR